MMGDALAARSHKCLLAYFDALRSLDPERIAHTFADECEIEDPIGSPIHRGRQAVAEYFAGGMCAAASRVEIEIVSALPASSSIAAHWRMTAKAKGGHEVDAEGIDVLEVDESGSIRRAEGYWDQRAFRVALAGS